MVEGNNISGNTDYGICLEGSKHTIVTENIISSNGFSGITMYFGWYAYSCNNTIRKNQISDNGKYGITSYHSINDSCLQNNISGNKIGVWLSKSENTCLKGNRLLNNSEGIRALNGSSTNLHWNDIANNEEYGINATGANYTINATNNWWGASSGPSGQGQGTGDTVSKHVLYSPWISPPEVEILSPLNNSLVTGSVDIVLYWRIQKPRNAVLYENGTILNSWRETGPLSYGWNTTSIDDGLYNISLSARSMGGEEFRRAIYLKVDNNPPTGRIGVPNGTAVSGKVNITVEWWDVSPKEARLYRNETLLQTWNTTGSKSYLWNLTLLASDTLGRKNSITIYVTVDNTEPPFISSSFQELMCIMKVVKEFFRGG